MLNVKFMEVERKSTKSNNQLEVTVCFSHL